MTVGIAGTQKEANMSRPSNNTLRTWLHLASKFTTSQSSRPSSLKPGPHHLYKVDDLLAASWNMFPCKQTRRWVRPAEVYWHESAAGHNVMARPCERNGVSLETSARSIMALSRRRRSRLVQLSLKLPWSPGNQLPDDVLSFSTAPPHEPLWWSHL